MHYDKPHHPNWFFVRGWNVRPCDCDGCEGSKYMRINMGGAARHIPIYNAPTVQPQLAPYDFGDSPYVTTSGGTNVPYTLTH